MSELQQQAIQLIRGLSDDNIGFLIEIIQRLMPPETHTADKHSDSSNESMGMQAFQRLDAARLDIKQYFSNSFNPEKELEKVRDEKYDSIDLAR